MTGNKKPLALSNVAVLSQGELIIALPGLALPVK